MKSNNAQEKEEDILSKDTSTESNHWTDPTKQSQQVIVKLESKPNNATNQLEFNDETINTASID